MDDTNEAVMDNEDEYEDVVLNEEQEEEEKCIILRDSFNNGENFNNGDEYDDSEDEEEKYPSFKQPDFTFDQHSSFWEDDVVPAAILSFLFLICILISYIGYENELGGNKYAATIGSFSIWSIITLIFILFDRNSSEHKKDKQLKIKNMNEYNEEDYKPYYSDDEDDEENNNRGFHENLAPR